MCACVRCGSFGLHWARAAVLDFGLVFHEACSSVLIVLVLIVLGSHIQSVLSPCSAHGVARVRECVGGNFGAVWPPRCEVDSMLPGAGGGHCPMPPPHALR